MSDINALIAQGSKFGNAFGNFADSYEEAQKIQQAQAYRNALLQQQQAQDTALAGRHKDQMALDRDKLAADTGYNNRNLNEQIRYHNAEIANANRRTEPDAITEYNFALGHGFQGNYADWLTRKAAAAGQGAYKPPTGYQANPNKPGELQPIPGGPAAAAAKRGNIPQTIVTNAQKIDRAYNTLSGAIGDYKALIGRTGMTYAPGQDTNDVRQSRQNILLIGKELFNLGVLNGGDERVLNDLIYNPEVSATNPGQAISTLYHAAKGDVAQQAGHSLDGLLAKIKQNRDSAVKGILPDAGGPAGGFGGGGNGDIPQSFIDSGGTPDEWQHVEDPSLWQ